MYFFTLIALESIYSNILLKPFILLKTLNNHYLQHVNYTFTSHISLCTLISQFGYALRNPIGKQRILHRILSHHHNLIISRVWKLENSVLLSYFTLPPLPNPCFSLSLFLHLARSLDQWARARATTINQSLSAICLPQQPITVARQLPHDKWIEEGWNGPACGLVCGGWGVHFIWSSPGCRQQHLQMTPDADLKHTHTQIYIDEQNDAYEAPFI